jgi:DNA-directed RNA polymerase specialized sigma subunit
MVETIARGFNTGDMSSGILDVMDLIQYGSIGLIAAVERFDVELSMSKESPERSIKSFLAKRIKGAIRRSVDNNRGTMKITEYRQNEIRKSSVGAELIFNSIFKSIDMHDADGLNHFYNIPEIDKTYNVELLNAYLLGIMKGVLNYEEFHTIRMFYGLDGPKKTAKLIAKHLVIDGINSSVRVSTIKKSAIEKLIQKIKPEQVLSFM